MTGDLQETAVFEALGATPAEDAAENERSVRHAYAENPEFAAEVESFRQVAAEMAELVAVEPPLRVKEQLMARVRNAAAGATGRQAHAMPPGVISIVRAQDGKWMPTPFAGITMKLLFADPASGNQSVLVRMEPGSVFPCHHHKGLEHSLVLEGDAIFSDHTLYAGDYEVGAPDQDHSSITTKGGCLVFIMRNAADILYAS